MTVSDLSFNEMMAEFSSAIEEQDRLLTEMYGEKHEEDKTIPVSSQETIQ